MKNLNFNNYKKNATPKNCENAVRYNELVADVTLAAQISLTQRRRISCLLLAHSTKTLPTELRVKKKEKEQLLF